MAKRVTDLPELTSADTNDLVPIVDISGNITKRVTVAGLVAAIASLLPDGSIKSAMLGLSKQTISDGWHVYDYGTFKKYMRSYSYGTGSNFTSADYSLPAGTTRSDFYITFAAVRDDVSGAYESNWDMLFKNATTFFFYRHREATVNPGGSTITVELTTK